MKEVLYLDVYFILNFLMDALSLFLAGLCLGEKAGIGRILSGALFGSVSASFGVLWQLPPTLTLLFGFCTLFPTVFFAFGKRGRRRFLFLCLFFLLAALFLGGAAQSVLFYTRGFSDGVRIGFGIFLFLVFFSLGLWTLWGKSLRRRLESGVIALTIAYGKEQREYYGLVDSGCLLRSPDRGDPVILLKAHSADGLLPPALLEGCRTGQTEGLIPIPVRTASGKTTLFAFRPRGATLYSKRYRACKKSISCLVALDFTEGGFAGCPCLVPLSAV